ncbi:UNVERIFIED_CONTAM: BES1/BZR1protein 4 [Sesamum radiatum]|uniref:Protein BZR1 homolog n=1 Tax=Sesamum radiatum TaxID=300843 RepID=A0AAW2KHM6_SESRA
MKECNANVRSAVEKERTKMRERQRRSITTNIFHGLRKHGGYRLSPRADINQVLRHLAQEAGWIVEPDGTTYRSATTPDPNVPVTNCSNLLFSKRFSLYA